MNASQEISNSVLSKLLDLTENTFKEEIDSTLDFITDICEISDAFLSIKLEKEDIIVLKKGPKNFENPNKIVFFNELTNRQEIIISTVTNKFYGNQLNNYKENFLFFECFPINAPYKLISANLCILNKDEKKLSEKELKIVTQCVSQIESILDLSLKNSELKTQLTEKKTQFESLVENTNEIIYELSTEGLITYVSKKWTQHVGHEAYEVIGKSNSDFIHPEDLEKCLNFLSNIKLNKNNNEEVTYRVLHKKGHYVWHSTKVNLIEKNAQQFYIGNCRDVTEYIETEQKLKNQKDFYETILNSLPTDVAVFDSNHKYTYLNPIAIKNKALREFIIGKDDFEYAIHTNRKNDFAIDRHNKFNTALQNKETLTWAEELHNATGEVTYHNRKFTPVFNEDGTLKIMIGFSVDITESKKAQNEIQKSRQLIKSIIENVAVGILVQGPKSEIIENNIAACEMLGLTQDQLLGKTSFDEYWQVIHKDGSSFKSENHPVPQAIKNLKPINNVVMGVHRPIQKDLIWLLVDAIPVFGEQHELLYVICSFNDITSQKNTVEELKISNERFTYVTKATSDVIWDWDFITDNIIMGDNFTELFGHQFNNKNNIITDEEYVSHIHPDDIEKVNKKLDLILLDKSIKKWNDEYRYMKSNGSYSYVKEKAHIIRNKKGKAIRMIGALTDITLEKKLKDELLSSEEKFKGAFEYSSIGIGLVNNYGYWIDANTQLCNILGYSKEELKSLTFIELTHPDDLENDLLKKDKLVSNEIPFFQMEKRYIHKNGEIICTNLSASTVRDNNGEIIYFIAQIIDITERKKVENENRLLLEENNRNRNIQLNEAKNLYRLLADNTIDLVCLHDLKMNFLYVSPSIKALLGHNPEDLIEKNPEDFVHPDDIVGMTNDLHKFISGNLITPIQYRYLNSKGEYIWLETIAKIVFENEIPVKIQTSTRDISKRKEAESVIEKTLKQERELNELRTNLVSTISHEFRTPMTTIRTSAELIGMYIDGQTFEKAQRVDKQLNTIIGEIDRIIELMNSVLTISRNDAGKTNFHPIQFDLKQLCIDVIETSFDNQKDGSKVQIFFEGTNFMVFADKNLMEYSLFNLINNAFKYSEARGDIKLNISSNSSKIILEIIDFGIGIPEEDQHKLFNTFFRASNTDGIQGTGLGLYIVKTFTEKNSGNIQLESQLGKGTKVTLQFPLQKQ